jgi:WD repeat-containing protein 70
VWDVRSYKKPLMVFENLANDIEETGCDFSPDGDHVITGTSGRKAKCIGSLIFVNTKTLKLVHEYKLDESSVIVRTIWHPRLNQIIMSYADGRTRILFDDELSIRGAKLCADKETRHLYDTTEMVSAQLGMATSTGIVTERSLKRRAEKARSDPIKSHRPDLPVSGQGSGGRVGTSLTSHLMKNIIKDTSREEDPREALLRHAQAAEANPIWVAPAYQRTQPKPVFSEDANDEEDDKYPAKQSERDRIMHQVQTPSTSHRK